MKRSLQAERRAAAEPARALLGGGAAHSLCRRLT